MRRSFKKGQMADTWRRKWRDIELTKKTVAFQNPEERRRAPIGWGDEAKPTRSGSVVPEGCHI